MFGGLQVIICIDSRARPTGLFGSQLLPRSVRARHYGHEALLCSHLLLAGHDLSAAHDELIRSSLQLYDSPLGCKVPHCRSWTCSFSRGKTVLGTSYG